METTIVEAVSTEVVEKRRGRPVVAGSARQLRLQERAERLDQGYVGRGRPVNPESKRQQVLQQRLDKIAQGIEIKRGRPKMVVAPEGEIA